MATLEKLEGSKVKLTIEVSAEEFEKAVQQAYVKTRKNYNVPGFRKGKAPRKVIENMYGPLVFFDEAFDIVYPDVYEAAIEEHGVTPVDRPEISILDLGNTEENKNIKFAAEVAVKPDVKLGEYKGIEAAKGEYNVTDEMVEAEIKKERENIARFVDVSRPVENGDTVNLDYSGSVDDVKFDGGTAEGQELVIGSDSFIPGFEEQMIGMKVDEERDLNVSFPEQYHAEDLAGKAAVFHVKVNAIKVKELPEADDDFAKDVSEFETIDELRNEKRRILTERAETEAKAEFESEVIKNAVENAQVEIPDAMAERQLNHMINDINYRLSMQGLNIDDYCKYTGTSVEAMRKEMKADAVNRVKVQLVLEEIGRTEQIKASEEEVNAKIDEYAKQFGDKADEFVKRLSDDDRVYFEDQIVLEKTVDMLTENAKAVAEKKEEKPKKARKTTKAKNEVKADEEAKEENENTEDK